MARKKNPNIKTSFTEESFTAEQIQELRRVKSDPIYFIEKYVKLKHPKRGIIPFELYDYQRELITSYNTYENNIVLSSRQSGKTETMCAYALWFAMYHPAKEILIVSNKGKNAIRLIAKLQMVYESIPHWLKIGIDADNWNKHTCAFENRSIIVAEATSEDAGRGMTIALLICDEFAFVRAHIQDKFWEAVLPTLSVGGRCIIASTPNGDVNLFAQMWRSAELNVNGFHTTKILWDDVPGRDEEFKEKKITELGSVAKWRQEYECEFLSNEQLLVDYITLQRYEKKIRTNKPEVVAELEGFKFWERISSSSNYIALLDPATGSGEDFSVINLFEYPSLKQVCTWRSNILSSPVIYAKFKNLLRFLERHSNSVYFTIENNGVGQGVISLYEADETAPADSYFISDKSKSQGMCTTPANKMPSCIKLKNMMEYDLIDIKCMDTITEFKSFIRAGGSYKANIGATDDCVSTLLLLVRCLQELAEGDADAFDLMNRHKIIDDADGFVTGYDDQDYLPILIS